MRTNRRNFLKKSALAGSAMSLAPIVLKAEERKSEYKLPYKNTYVKNSFVAENEFRRMDPDLIEPPSFENGKKVLPSPFWKGHDDAIDMYWKAWEIGIGHVRKPEPGSGFVSSYLDTAYNGNIFMWDSAFITMFARYGSRLFPFQQTLNNFYSLQHLDGFICREIMASGDDAFHRYDPVSTGPNIIPWSELEYYNHFGDWDRVNMIFPALAAFSRWLRLNRTWRDGSYWTSGWGTGMDNMPRVPKEYNLIYSHGHMVWLDACLQQLMVDKILLKFGFVLERWQEIEDIEDEIGLLSSYIREHLWDEKSGFLYDSFADGSLSITKGVGAYWALLADVLDKSQLDKLVNHLNDTNTFNRKFPVPSLSADHEKYQTDGRYWQGGIWAPTNFMIIKGLQKNGYDKQAFNIARRHHDQILQVFRDTGTFWEYYAPESANPGLLARPDFVGWTGLPPIAVLFEGVFGINVNLPEKSVNWKINLLEEHGIERYPMGKEGLLSFKCFTRNSPSEKPVLEIESNIELKLNLFWDGGGEQLIIQKGKNKF
ncbi:MGH1-like glycoside hydrolase domain-containing protein [Mangrovibacterium marinum]|uniref:Secreted protein n=1 Tax=Mangrovibacterium marinum TaxID=1639118 RepID=A0A2T5BXQ8_9BACT|nr:trehalase family glycosidase [Mangrovibacterium marinum]PTN05932.1 secreted protein [Mangrovibacterium marinum]